MCSFSEFHWQLPKHLCYNGLRPGAKETPGHTFAKREDKTMTLRSTTVVAALATVAGTAAATDVQLRFLETGAGRNVSVTLNGDTNTFFAGQLIHEVQTSSAPTLSVDGRITTFCVEIEERTNGSFDTFAVSVLDDQVIPAAVGATGSARTQAALDVADAFYAIAADAAATNNEAAAFQLLLWEIVYDYDPTAGLSSIDPTTGNLTLARGNGDPLWSAVDSLIDTFSAAIGSNSTSRAFSLLTNNGKQDQIVPTPGSIALLGLVGLTAARRRR